MRKVSAEIFLIILAFVFIVGSGPAAMAQETGGDTFMLEEITVTAQKREENQQKVPIAMEVISGEEVKEQGMSNLADMLRGVGAVMVDTGADGMKVVIRSVSEDKSNPSTFQLETGTPVVSVNVDGVYTNKQNNGSGFYDVERVEVLFGPQSTMYATTSPAGMVNIVTTEPRLEDYEASGTFEYGNYDKMRFEGAMNAPISDTVALRAAYMSSTRDGYMDNGAGEDDTQSGRLKALYQPNEKLSIILTGERVVGGGMGVTTVEPFIDQDDASDPWTSNQTTIWTPSQETTNLYANISYDFGFGSLTVIPARKDINIEETGEAEDFFGNVEVRHTYNTGLEKGVEARLVSSEDFPIKWIAGANWYKSEYVRGYTAENGNFEDTAQIQNIKAIYGNVTYPVSEEFRVTGGIRYSDDENYSDQYSYPAFGGVYVSVDPVTGIGHEVVDTSYNSPDYKLGIEYDVSENKMIYADYSTSYRAQKGADEFNNMFDPEILKAYTIGSKNRFFDNRLQVNAAAYYYDYENYMAMCGYINSIFMEDLNGDGDYDDLNQWDERRNRYSDEYILGTRDPNGRTTGDAWIAGLDVSANWVITDSDRIDFSVSYMKTEFSDLYVDYWETTNALGIDDLDLSGKPMTNSPEWKINAGYGHEFHLWNGGNLTPRVDLTYVSEYPLHYHPIQTNLDRSYQVYVTDYSEFATQEAYHMTDLSATYASPNGKWSLSAYVRNLENYAVKTRVSLSPEGLSIGQPRMYGVVLSLKYN